jgi:hypothetical protein
VEERSLSRGARRIRQHALKAAQSDSLELLKTEGA